MATTSNFGWETPDDTDYVKDGAAAMRTLGSAIDASMVDLKGGTTGQILSKASNTDMDFAWAAAPSTDTLIPKSIIDAAGDLIIGTANDTPARLAIGTNGQVLTSNGTTAAWATPSSGSMTLIESKSIAGVGSVTFSSVPQTYKHLQLIVKNVTGGTNGSQFGVRLNGSTDSYFGVIGSSAGWNSMGSGDRFYITYSATQYLSSAVVNFYDYTTDNSNNSKLIQAQSAQYTSPTFVMGVHISEPTTSVTFVGAGTYTAGTIELYGVN